MANSPKRILLIRTDRIGDVVLTTPVATILREHFPGLHIGFLANPYTEPLLKRHGHIDDILVYDKLGKHRGLFGHLRLLRELRRGNYDTAIMFYPRPALAIVLFLSGIPRRIATARRWYSFLFNQRVQLRRRHGQHHEAEHNLRLLEPLLFADPNEIRFEFTAPRQPLESIRKQLGLNSEYVIIHPGSGGSAPNLSVRQYRLICNYLLQHSRFELLFTGTAAESARIREIMTDLPAARITDSSGQFDMEKLLGAISGAALLISSSTGPLHIANALGVAVMSYYCPAPPVALQRWGPYRQDQWVLVPQVLPCERGKPELCQNGNCLAQISDDELRKMLKKRLKSIERQ